MHTPEALILRRCYPVPVTHDDLYKAVVMADMVGILTEGAQRATTAALKEVTGALDEVYAVVDGREVRVATASGDCWSWTGALTSHPLRSAIDDLLDAANRKGYWARPHEVRITLQERPVSRDEVARAVLVGQEYVERGGAL